MIERQCHGTIRSED